MNNNKNTSHSNNNCNQRKQYTCTTTHKPSRPPPPIQSPPLLFYSTFKVLNCHYEEDRDLFIFVLTSQQLIIVLLRIHGLSALDSASGSVISSETLSTYAKHVQTQSIKTGAKLAWSESGAEAVVSKRGQYLATLFPLLSFNSSRFKPNL